MTQTTAAAPSKCLSAACCCGESDTDQARRVKVMLTAKPADHGWRQISFAVQNVMDAVQSSNGWHKVFRRQAVLLHHEAQILSRRIASLNGTFSFLIGAHERCHGIEPYGFIGSGRRVMSHQSFNLCERTLMRRRISNGIDFMH